MNRATERLRALSALHEEYLPEGFHKNRAAGIVLLFSRDLAGGAPGSEGVDLTAPPVRENEYAGLSNGSPQFQGAVKRLNRLIRPDGPWKWAAWVAYQAALLWPDQQLAQAYRKLAMLEAVAEGQPGQGVEEIASPEARVGEWLTLSPEARNARIASFPREVQRLVRTMADPLMLLLWLYSATRHRAEGYCPALRAMGGLGQWTIKNPGLPPPEPRDLLASFSAARRGLQELMPPPRLPPLPLYPLTDPAARGIAARLANEPDPLGRLRVCSDPRCTLDAAPHTCRRRGHPPVKGEGPFYVDRASGHLVKASDACCPTHLGWVRFKRWPRWVIAADPAST